MLARPERFFEDRFGFTSRLMERLLGSHLAGRVDDADLYLEYRVSEELTLEEGAVKKASRHVSQGAGVRAQSGERTGYAHTDDLALPNLEEAARQARAIADQSGSVGRSWPSGPAARTISTRSPSRPSPPRSTASSPCSGGSTRRPAPSTRASSRSSRASAARTWSS